MADPRRFPCPECSGRGTWQDPMGATVCWHCYGTGEELPTREELEAAEAELGPAYQGMAARRIAELDNDYAATAAHGGNMARKNSTTEHTLDLQEGESTDQTNLAQLMDGMVDQGIIAKSPEEPPPEPRRRGRKPGSTNKAKPEALPDPDLLVVANYIAKRNELRAQNRAIAAQIDAMTDELTERQVKLAEAVEAVQ